MAPGGAAGAAKKNFASGAVKSEPAKNAPLRSRPPRMTATSGCSREVVLLYARTLLAAVFVLFIVHIHPRDSAAVPQIVEVTNPAEHDLALCWLQFGSAYAREEQLLRNAPEGCHRVPAGAGTGDRDAFELNSYVGHRFLVLPWPEQDGNAAASSAYHFVYIKPGMGKYTVEDFTAEGNLDINRLLNILQNPADTWQTLLRFRHYFSMFLVSLCLLCLQFGSSGSETTSVRNRNATSKSMIKPNTNMMVHRHSLKAFAVSTMLLNHVSYLIFEENSLGRFAGTIPADLAGSAQLFWFLAGYNSSSPGTARPSSGPRSESTKLLAVFFLLEQFCTLPPPITYETLFTIFVARSLLKLGPFQAENCIHHARNENDADGGGGEAPSQSGESRFTHLPLYVHAVLCGSLIALHPYLNADGLRLVQTKGILYAVAGRLLGNTAVGELESGGRARCVGLFWLFSAWAWQFKIASEFYLHNLETGSAKYAVAWICAVGAIFQFFVLTVPAEEMLWLPSRASTFVSRYSLEIYCLHLGMLWCFYGR